MPEGTEISLNGHHVIIEFPTTDDAIVFHEFLRSFVLGEIEIEAVGR